MKGSINDTVMTCASSGILKKILNRKSVETVDKGYTLRSFLEPLFRRCLFCTSLLAFVT